jgi:broad specificity phosphatase PhoE
VTSRITFISHAPTLAIRRAAFPSDEPLEDGEFGKLQQTNWSAPKADRILCGPELRTRQTAEGLGLEASAADELRDCDYGSWRGRELSEIQLSEPENLGLWLTDPDRAPHGGESIARLIDRAKAWMETLGDVGHVIAVTHPAVIRGTILHTLGAPAQAFWRVDIAPVTLTDLRFGGRSWTVRSVGCPLRHKGAEHLGG